MTNDLHFGKDSRHRDELQEIWRIAAHLVAGHGGPPEYRRPASTLSALPAYRKANLDVILLATPYGPLAAMCLASFVLYGLTFENDLARLGIGGDLIEAYDALVREFGMVHALDLRAPSAPQLPGEALREALAGSQQKSRLLTFKISKPALSPARMTPAGLTLPGATVFPALPGGGRS